MELRLHPASLATMLLVSVAVGAGAGAGMSVRGGVLVWLLWRRHGLIRLLLRRHRLVQLLCRGLVRLRAGGW